MVQLFPDRIAGVCQLPQSPGVPIDRSIGELLRCVLELGFVGCNLNPDPSGGRDFVGTRMCRTEPGIICLAEVCGSGPEGRRPG